MHRYLHSIFDLLQGAYLPIHFPHLPRRNQLPEPLPSLAHFPRAQLMLAALCAHLPQAASTALLSVRHRWAWREVVGVLDLPPAALSTSPMLTPLLQAAREAVWDAFEDLELAWGDQVGVAGVGKCYKCEFVWERRHPCIPCVLHAFRPAPLPQSHCHAHHQSGCAASAMCCVQRCLSTQNPRPKGMHLHPSLPSFQPLLFSSCPCAPRPSGLCGWSCL